MDFCDKLVISITLIIVTIFCVLNNFCSAVSTSINIANNLKVDYNNSRIIENNGTFIGFIVVNGLTKITITNNNPSTLIGAGISDGLVSGSTSTLLFNIPAGQTLTSFVNEENFKYVVFYAGPGYITNNLLKNLSVSVEVSSMKSTVALLSNSLYISNFWNIFEKSVPYIAVVVLSSFGFYLIIHNILELSKGRDD